MAAAFLSTAALSCCLRQQTARRPGFRERCSSPRIARHTTASRRPQRAWKNGSAAVGLAMTLPLLVRLGLGVMDFGALTGTSSALERATRAAAEVVWAHPSETGAELTRVGIFPRGA